MKISSNFAGQYNLQERRRFFILLTQLHDGRIPILVRVLEAKSSSSDQDLFLSKPSTTLYMLLLKIKKKIAMSPLNTIYLFCKGRLLSPQAFISQLYEKHKSDDGFLYLEVASTPSLGIAKLFN